MRACSEDLRERVVGSYYEGEGTHKELAERYHVSKSSVNRWVQQYRKLGHLKPSDAPRGPKPTFTDENQNILHELISSRSDATLEEYQSLLSENYKIQVHPSTISRGFSKASLTRKKNSSGKRARTRRCSKTKSCVFFSP